MPQVNYLKTRFFVTGMRCNKCVNKIESNIKEVLGVSEIKVCSFLLSCRRHSKALKILRRAVNVVCSRAVRVMIVSGSWIGVLTTKNQCNSFYAPPSLQQVNLKDGYTDICYDPAITNENYLQDCLTQLGYTVRLANENQETTIYITGMKCMSCVRKITTNLSLKNGIHSISVSIRFFCINILERCAACY